MDPIRLSPDAIGIGEQTHFVIFKEKIHGRDIYIVGYEFNPFGVRISKFAEYLKEKSSVINVKDVKYYVLWDRNYVQRILDQREIKSILLKVHVPRWFVSIHSIGDFLKKGSTTGIRGLYESISSLLKGLDDENMYTISISIVAKRKRFLDKSKIKEMLVKVFNAIRTLFGGEVRMSPFMRINITL